MLLNLNIVIKQGQLASVSVSLLVSTDRAYVSKLALPKLGLLTTATCTLAEPLSSLPRTCIIEYRAGRLSPSGSKGPNPLEAESQDGPI